ncbi:MAG: hypothetical protein NTY38_00915, partial [Acidobacteria bacterium]|nr:hypothetical protein [Acidobacteriota bacterium]
IHVARAVAPDDGSPDYLVSDGNTNGIPDRLYFSGGSNAPVTTVTNYLAWARRELKRAVLERIQSVTATRRELRDEARAMFGSPKP